MSEHKKISTHLSMSVATLFWGLSFIAIKIALRSYSPVTLVTVRLFFVAVILATIFLLSRGLDNLPARKDIPLLLFIGFLNPFLAFLLETTGMQYVTASLTSVMMSTVPLFTPLAAFIILQERVGLFNIIGLLLSFVGICFIILSRGAEIDYTIKGLIFLTCAVFSGVLYTVIAKKLLDHYATLTIVTFQQIFGFLMYIPVFLITGTDDLFLKGSFDATGFLSILFLAVFPSSISYYIFNAGIKKIGPTRANAYLNLTPVITAIASYFILREAVSPLKAAGIIIVITGLFLSQRKKT